MSFRLATNSVGSSRENSEEKQPLPKLFFVAEGAETEIIYLNEFKIKYSDKLLGELIIFNKIDISRSNQLFIVKNIDNFLHAAINMDEEILNKIGDIKEDILTTSDISNEKLNEKIDLINDLSSQVSNNPLFQDFQLLTKENSLEFLNALVELQGFEVGYDKVIIIIDRDKQSFKPYQYDEVISIAQKSGLLLGITNPCFELFLLLHLKSPVSLDLQKIQENKRYSRSKKSKKYVEHILNEAMKEIGDSYKKSQYNANILIDNFETLAVNASSDLIAKNIIDVKETIGTTLYEVLKPYIKN